MTPAPAEPPDDRTAELATALGRVRGRIADACVAVGRPVDEVTLVAITKTYPAADVERLVRLGVGDIGENRDAEAAPKADEVAGLLAGDGRELPPPRWHFVGQLQRNKCRSVVRYAELVHSVDRAPLVEALAHAVARDRPERPLPVLLQVSLDGDPHRGGVPVAELAGLADTVAGRDELLLRGVMAVAPLGGDPDRAFAELVAAGVRLRAGHPAATVVSAGMSGDLEQAITHGATHVRVGSALLGRRPTPG